MNELLAKQQSLLDSIPQSLEKLRKREIIDKNNYIAPRIRYRLYISCLKDTWLQCLQVHVALLQGIPEAERESIEYFKTNQFDLHEGLYQETLDYLTDCLENIEPSVSAISSKSQTNQEYNAMSSFSLSHLQHIIQKSGNMDGRKFCKGCGDMVIVNPIVCAWCGIASHPACLPLTGHPQQGGRFLNCTTIESGSQYTGEIRDMIHSEIRPELANFRKEILEVKANIEKIKDSIQQLSDRINNLKTCELHTNVIPISHEADIWLEISERERRSRNVMLFHLDETEPNSDVSDLDLAKNILQTILPNQIPEVSVTRMGKKRRKHSRPLCITFKSKEEATTVLHNKRKYSGSVRIAQDQTMKQRNHWKDIKAQLKVLLDAGENKTIRYFDGVPKIVDARINSKPKNT